MPDPVLMLKAMAAAAGLAAIVLLACSWPWRAPRPRRAAFGGVLGVGLGFYVGCWWLGTRPHWPPREDQDRLLLVLFPAVIVVELVAAVFKSEIRNPKSETGISSFGFWILDFRVWLPWLLRLVVAVTAARILLHDSSYIADLSGPDTRQWTSEQTWMILGGLAVSLAGVWILLSWLSQREPGRAVPLAVAVACAGTAVTIMMSAYASGGPLVMPLAGAVVGALVASLVIKGGIPLDGLLGLSMVGLFAVIVMGRFFGELTWTNAALLFFAPLLCWLAELSPIGRAKPRLRALAGIVLTAVPVSLALTLAQQKFVEESAQTSPNSQEPSLEDYMNFGK